MADNQKQRAGDGSVNLQVGTVSVGLSYADVHRVAMDVFEANFQRLAGVAADVAAERARAFFSRVMHEMTIAKSPLAVLGDPDFQCDLAEAGRAYARTGNVETGDLLARLLTQRSLANAPGLKQIVLNEAVGVAGKLTSDQLDTLSIVFWLRHMHRDIQTPEEYFHAMREELVPLLRGAPTLEAGYQHMEYTGCASMLSFDPGELGYVLGGWLPGAFSRGIPEENLASVASLPKEWFIPCVNEPSRTQLRFMTMGSLLKRGKQEAVPDEKMKLAGHALTAWLLDAKAVERLVTERVPEAKALLERWNGTSVRRASLTSVGIALAVANFRLRLGIDLDLGRWMRSPDPTVAA